MGIELVKPVAADWPEVLAALAHWQDDTAAMQLHPGDIGWFWRNGGDLTAESVWTWRCDGALAAIALLDGPSVLRVTTAPAMRRDEAANRQIANDINDRRTGVLPIAEGNVELPIDSVMREHLAELGWVDDESWTPLQLDLTQPPRPQDQLEIVIADERHAGDRADVQRASFVGSSFTEHNWRSMATSPAYADARCLIGFVDGAAIAMATVWSAGAGRPGLLEPIGVHHEHRGHGYGTAISLAAAQALHEMGASSALVCTPTANTAAIAAYQAAGFVALPERLDKRSPSRD